MRNYFWLTVAVVTLFIASLPTSAQDEHTIKSGKITASFTKSGGLTAVSFDGQQVWKGSTTRLTGQWMTLVRNVEVLKTTPRRVKGSDVPIPIIWQIVDTINTNPTKGSDARPKVTVVNATSDRYTIRHEHRNGLSITFDHTVAYPDITCRITMDNDGRDYFQIVTWMDGSQFQFKTTPTRFRGTGSFYPSALTYSPVLALWDDRYGVGINWIEHRCRSVLIDSPNVQASERPVSFKLCDPKGGAATRYNPIESGGRTRYAVTFRIDGTPGDWKNLLMPYKTWFNGYFGPCTYNVDFRMKVMINPSNAGLIKEGNPWGTRGRIDTEGWGTYIKSQLEGLRKYPGVASHIVFWSILADPRGVNYRPEFNVIPPITRETMPILRQFCRETQMGFGWFARPHAIAYKSTWEKDASVGWNAFNAGAIRMSDLRYRDLLDMGCTSFYMDTYGGHVGYSPNDGEASVMYLKHLREITGPDCFTFIEHGFDAQHVHAVIWPPGQDELGKRPIGEYAHWLTPGTSELCRITGIEGAKRAWEEGGIPIVMQITDEMAALQKQYVNDDWTSKKRPDCKPAKSPVPLAEEFFTKKTGGKLTISECRAAS